MKKMSSFLRPGGRRRAAQAKEHGQSGIEEQPRHCCRPKGQEGEWAEEQGRKGRVVGWQCGLDAGCLTVARESGRIVE